MRHGDLGLGGTELESGDVPESRTSASSGSTHASHQQPENFSHSVVLTTLFNCLLIDAQRVEREWRFVNVPTTPQHNDRR